jgi:hypothetical protein
MKRFWIAMLPGVAMLGAISTIPADVEAAPLSRLQHALSCYVNSGTTTNNAGGQVVNGTGETVELICPILSNTGLHVQNPNVTLTVKGWSNGSSWKAKVCTAFADGHSPGFDCGTEFVAPIGLVSQPLDLSKASAANAFDYPYLVVTLGAQAGGSSNVLFGSRLFKP